MRILFRSVRLLAFALGGLFFVTAAWAGSQEAYVWQRQFGDEVSASLESFQPLLDGCCVLAAEVAWKDGRMEVARPTVQFETLAGFGKPVGLALRIGAGPAVLQRDERTRRQLAALANDLIAQARSGGLTAAELQVDYDCAESKLAAYREWIVALRAAVAPVPIVFTALPAWLKSADFAPLARAADGFVLQVHSLARPAGPDAEFTLCDPVKALAWARQADAVGVPFRVALPTYGYELAFAADGTLLGLSAEGPRRSWPVEAQRRIVRADAVAMMRLAAALDEASLAHLRGVIWFRLPVAGDRLNWAPRTFAAVLRGTEPVRAIGVAVEWSEPGLAEIVVVNRGETSEPLPASVALRWPAEEKLLASDGLGGFSLEIRAGEAQGISRAKNVTTGTVVAPGGQEKIAWLRFAHEVPVEVSLPAAP